MGRFNPEMHCLQHPAFKSKKYTSFIMRCEIHRRIMVHLHQKRSAVPKITDALDKEPFVKLQNYSRLQMFLDRVAHFSR